MEARTEALERRLADLESRVFGRSAVERKAADGIDLARSTSLAEDIAELRAVLDGAGRSAERVAFADRYAEVKEGLDASPWDWRAKMELVLASEDEVRRNVDLVQEIEGLRESISAAALDKLPEWRAKADALDAKQRAAAAFVSGFHAQVNELLAEYNAFVSAVSQKFVLWDESLAACQRQVER
jgi:hypothetical protein